MTNPHHSLVQSAHDDGFEFTGQARKIPQVAAIHLRWPTKSNIAGNYISDWNSRAAAGLAELRLSRETLDHIASHTSRVDGTCRLTDGQLSSRSGRSLRSTQRDIDRLKKLGWLLIEYVGGDQRQERIRVLRISHPLEGRSRQRIPEPTAGEVSPTYTPYVGGPDMGERRDVE